MTTYIAGPMTGYPNFNYPEFAYVAGILRDRGVDVRSPHEIDAGGIERPWEWYMRACLKMLTDCDEILMLVGWQKSRGARLEHYIAEKLGVKITEWAGSCA